VKRPVHSDAANPACEGGGVLAVADLGWAVIGHDFSGLVTCPSCGHVFCITKAGRVRRHRRAPDPSESRARNAREGTTTERPGQ
jgi:hypothetical protein